MTFEVECGRGVLAGKGLHVCEWYDSSGRCGVCLECDDVGMDEKDGATECVRGYLRHCFRCFDCLTSWPLLKMTKS